MTALPNPAPDNARRDLVARFRDDYTLALEEARTSEVHTNTDGWLHLYAGFEVSYREQCRAIANNLKSLADRIELVGSDEPTEKEIGEVKKLAQSLRQTREVFERKTVDPVRKPVDDCDRLIQQYARQAERDEDEAPMVNVGLADLMKLEIGRMPRPFWDRDKGRVEIREPNRAA